MNYFFAYFTFTWQLVGCFCVALVAFTGKVSNSIYTRMFTSTVSYCTFIDIWIQNIFIKFLCKIIYFYVLWIPICIRLVSITIGNMVSRSFCASAKLWNDLCDDPFKNLIFRTTSMHLATWSQLSSRPKFCYNIINIGWNMIMKCFIEQKVDNKTMWPKNIYGIPNIMLIIFPGYKQKINWILLGKIIY